MTEEGTTYYIATLSDDLVIGYRDASLVVKSPKQLKQQEHNDSDKLIILCEQSHDEEGKEVNRTDFHGMKLAQSLRRRGFAGAILFVSMMEERYFLSDLERFKLMRYEAGHGFLRLPESLEMLQKAVKAIKPLSELALEDVRVLATDVKGIVRELLHKLRSMVEDDMDDDAHTLIELVCKSTEKDASEQINNYKSQKNKTDKLSMLTALAGAVPAEEENDESLSTALASEFRWRILWLDDDIYAKCEEHFKPKKKADDTSAGEKEPKEQESKNEESASDSTEDRPAREAISSKIPLLDYLSKIDNVEVTVVGTYEDALAEMEADRLQNIRVVISDYRIEKSDKYPSKQGYDFIHHIAQAYPTLAIFAYSGLPRKFMMSTIGQYSQKITPLSKQDFPLDSESQYRYIAELIIEAGDRAWMELNNAPVGAKWRKMKDNYFEFKNSPGFNDWSTELNEFLQLDIDAYSASNYSDTFKLNGFDKQEKFEVKNTEYSAKKDSNNGLKRLKNRLYARRFLSYFLAQAVQENNDLTEEYEKIQNIFANSLEKKPKNLKEWKISQQLALGTTGFPLHLLPEEYDWLEYDSDLNFSIKKKSDSFR